MKLHWKYTALLLISIFTASFLAGGFFLPSAAETENTIEINRSASEVYATLIDIEQWERWSLWSSKVDATMEVEFQPHPNITGSEMLWSGKYSGKGNLVFKHAVQDSELHIMLNIQDGKFQLPGIIRLEIVSPEKTNVRWTNTVRFGNNPMKRYIGSSIVSVIERDIGFCLNGLKEYAEK